ncbi:hypothetical protein [Herbaspirillum robiniae]|uniref:Uncharacterized protein n=1 Tax=Herbaspirillum robiniae TaxID=2014887 RepID=A0ABX2LQE6_9BURK|nr:hypothetical protein [Herbaspirillum robiniae]NUU00634.1 hypothetical protein [Herbaspirillum robiniae]
MQDLKQEIYTNTLRAIRESGLSVDDPARLALDILIATRIYAGPQDNEKYVELVTIFPSTKQGIRTARGHINPFGLCSAVLSSSAATLGTIPAAVAFISALFAAFTVSLSPEQAAFFLAVTQLKNEKQDIDLDSIVGRMCSILHQTHYSCSQLLVLIDALGQLGCRIHVHPDTKVVSVGEVIILI